jgi:hypothetical protein
MKWDIAIEPYQDRFYQSRARFPAFVAAWGTGKTTMGILKGMDLSIRYPGNLGLVVRASFRDLQDSTMSDFTKYTGIKIPSSKNVKLANGSEIMFRHLDELAGITQNVNLGWFYIEQAEEFESDKEFELLGGRLRRKDCFRQGFIIANTNGHNWIWRKWKNVGGEEYMCDKPYNPPTGVDGIEYSGYASLTEATTFDNIRNLPPDFIAALEIKKTTAPANYRRFVLNSWEDTDTADKVIPYESLLKSVNRDLRDYCDDYVVISCDPAEQGDDKSVILVFKGCKIIDSLVTEKKELMETAGNIMAKFHQHFANCIVIDDIGVGAGVRSRLREIMGPDKSHVIMPINTGRAARDPVRFNRLRDEIWMHASQLFKDGYVSIPKDDTMVEDLAAMTYSMNSKGQVQVARKKDVKKLLGRSPDRGDAVVMGLFAAKKAQKKERVLVGAGASESYDPLTFGLN